jgi:hypothetical protein
MHQRGVEKADRRAFMLHGEAEVMIFLHRDSGARFAYRGKRGPLPRREGPPGQRGPGLCGRSRNGLSAARASYRSRPKPKSSRAASPERGARGFRGRRRSVKEPKGGRGKTRARGRPGVPGSARRPAAFERPPRLVACPLSASKYPSSADRPASRQAASSHVFRLPRLQLCTGAK